MKFPVLIILCAAALAGCSSGPKYACGLPDGVGCKSVSQVYAGAKNGARSGSSTVKPAGSGGSSESGVEIGSQSRPVIATVKPGETVLTTPKYARMWINRWEDSEGDMNDETFIYLRLNNGYWTLKK